MMHPALSNLGYLRTASDEGIERAVDALIEEASFHGEWFEESQAARAEALAILAHEIRRREQ